MEKLRTEIRTVDGMHHIYQGGELFKEISECIINGNQWATIILPNQSVNICINHIITYKLLKI